MTANRLRLLLIALLAIAAVVAGVGHKSGNPWIVWLSYAVFIVAVAVWFHWRRHIRGRVLDREDKTRE